MKLSDFKKVLDDKYEQMERFNEIENTDVIITKSSGYPLILFMRDQEVLDYIKVKKWQSK